MDFPSPGPILGISIASVWSRNAESIILINNDIVISCLRMADRQSGAGTSVAPKIEALAATGPKRADTCARITCYQRLQPCAGSS